MANNFSLAKNYTNILSEAFCQASKTAKLSGDNDFVKAGNGANEIVYPVTEVGGLGDYSRTTGYTTAGASLEWKTATFNYDRGARLIVDAMDDEETMNKAFSVIGGELMRTRVAPEQDAFTFATLYGLDGVSIATPATYTGADDFLAALRAAVVAMDEDEVPESGRYLFATPALLSSLDDLDTYKSKKILEGFAGVERVPQKRFYSAITLGDGSSENDAGHFAPAVGAYELNFMIVYQPALIMYDKHVVRHIITPDNNPTADAYIMKYRRYAIVDAKVNQRAGIYFAPSAVTVAAPATPDEGESDPG